MCSEKSYPKEIDWSADHFQTEEKYLKDKDYRLAIIGFAQSPNDPPKWVVEACRKFVSKFSEIDQAIINIAVRGKQANAKTKKFCLSELKRSHREHRPIYSTSRGGRPGNASDHEKVERINEILAQNCAAELSVKTVKDALTNDAFQKAVKLTIREFEAIDKECDVSEIRPPKSEEREYERLIGKAKRQFKAAELEGEPFPPRFVESYLKENKVRLRWRKPVKE
ncbi:hypothetical protein [Terasakiella sp.]|uniref:hypothetical protein n=1 Tax=Terasakiella sp. TaxID=2034861 RepID=UPI003AA7F598